ncbi:hypothetical protein NC651_016737 [Populus alba x Populus x berolinensis]|nr:hypothetical protein NC651_016737 [Populus alba x Populus x berolinensis]
MQLIISERIGISPHQFSIFLVNREKRGSRIPVAARTNFSKIYREKDWLFIVVLKRSRRERRIKGHEMMTGNTVRDDNSVAINGNGLPGLDLGRVDYGPWVSLVCLQNCYFRVSVISGSDCTAH